MMCAVCVLLLVACKDGKREQGAAQPTAAQAASAKLITWSSCTPEGAPLRTVPLSVIEYS